ATLAASRGKPLPSTTRETVPFSQSGPTPVCVDDQSISHRTGCHVITLSFPQPTQLGEITFRNYYTWAVGVQVLRATSVSSGVGGVVGAGLLDAGADTVWVWRDPQAWRVSVRNKVIMPHPHTEAASHDFVSITCLESKEDWQDVVGMRLVLRQPSPVWRTFFIEDITVYRELPRMQPFSVPIIGEKGKSGQQQNQLHQSPLERLIQQTKRALKPPDDPQLQAAPGPRCYELQTLQYA
ncbi:unnamed protein product, partial [Meganyctiphanes norvegica]